MGRALVEEAGIEFDREEPLAGSLLNLIR